MRKTTPLFIILLISFSSFGQETQKFAEKITANICDCVGQINKYNQLQSKLNDCYDKEINEAAIHATPDEIKIIGSIEEFNKTKKLIGQLIKTDCATVRQLVESEARPTANEKSYPVNFNENDYKDAKTNPKKWDGKIIAFDGKIVEVNYISTNKPYLKVKMSDGQTIWIGSMVNSKYDKEGNSIRFLGYFTLTTDNDVSRKYHSEGFHVLVFGEIEHETKQVAFMPGSELQIKEWGSGTVPKGQN